ncbi:MAG TPA: hypothetical protein VIJ14_01375, partial [Rhabdochlamydiaceae bacterium]
MSSLPAHLSDVVRTSVESISDDVSRGSEGNPVTADIQTAVNTGGVIGSSVVPDDISTGSLSDPEVTFPAFAPDSWIGDMSTKDLKAYLFTRLQEQEDLSATEDKLAESLFVDLCSTCSESVLGKRKDREDDDDIEGDSARLKRQSVASPAPHAKSSHDQAERVPIHHEGEKTSQHVGTEMVESEAEKEDEIDASTAMVIWIDPEEVSMHTLNEQELGIEIERLKEVFVEAEEEEREVIEINEDLIDEEDRLVGEKLKEEVVQMYKATEPEYDSDIERLFDDNWPTEDVPAPVQRQTPTVQSRQSVEAEQEAVWFKEVKAEVLGSSSTTIPASKTNPEEVQIG